MRPSTPPIPAPPTGPCPAGKISRRATLLFIGVSSVIFMGAAAQLNRICFALSPVVLLVILGYSLTKRFTAATHLVLGLSLGLAPLGGWLAVRGDLGLSVLVLAGAVLFWVAGFDVLYALQDEEFDRRVGLYSLPAGSGRPGPAAWRRSATWRPRWGLPLPAGWPVWVPSMPGP